MPTCSRTPTWGVLRQRWRYHCHPPTLPTFTKPLPLHRNSSSSLNPPVLPYSFIKMQSKTHTSQHSSTIRPLRVLHPRGVLQLWRYVNSRLVKCNILLTWWYRSITQSQPQQRPALPHHKSLATYNVLPQQPSRHWRQPSHLRHLSKINTGRGSNNLLSLSLSLSHISGAFNATTITNMPLVDNERAVRRQDHSIDIHRRLFLCQACAWGGI